MKSLKKTPLNGIHRGLKAKMVDFTGWEMPLNYPPGILAEHLATRKFVGLFDISHMGRFLIRGRDALPFLQYVLTNNVAALLPGQSQYGMIPNESGGAVDDIYLYKIDENEYILVVNAANMEKDWAWLQDHKQKFPKLALENLGDRIAMLSLQGPRARAILEVILGEFKRLPEPARNNLANIEIFSVKVPLARTGYTGEPICFEMFPPVEIVVRLWNELLEVGKNEGITPVGLGARDTLRLEAGLPLYGHELGTDLDGKEIPVFALPLARVAVSFSEVKAGFIGKEILMKQFQEVQLRMEGRLDMAKDQQLVPKMIMPMAIPDGSVARAGYSVCVGDETVGIVTSGTMVPYWKTEDSGIQSKPGSETGRRAICLAYLDASLKKDQKTKVAIRNKVADGVIVDRHISNEAPPYARPQLLRE
jgi:aminomethyltransferase